MNTAYLMVILSLLGDGEMSAAFVNTDNLANCQQRAEVIRSILTSAGTDLRRIACVPSALRFEKFSHGAPKDAPRHAYLVELTSRSVSVAPVADIDACQRLRAANPDVAGGQRLCVTSTQKLLADGRETGAARPARPQIASGELAPPGVKRAE